LIFERLTRIIRSVLEVISGIIDTVPSIRNGIVNAFAEPLRWPFTIRAACRADQDQSSQCIAGR
jgi:hypothetical protein